MCSLPPWVRSCEERMGIYTLRGMPRDVIRTLNWGRSCIVLCPWKWESKVCMWQSLWSMFSRGPVISFSEIIKWPLNRYGIMQGLQKLIFLYRLWIWSSTFVHVGEMITPLPYLSIFCMSWRLCRSCLSFTYSPTTILASWWAIDENCIGLYCLAYCWHTLSPLKS